MKATVPASKEKGPCDKIAEVFPQKIPQKYRHSSKKLKAFLSNLYMLGYRVHLYHLDLSSNFQHKYRSAGLRKMGVFLCHCSDAQSPDRLRLQVTNPRELIALYRRAVRAGFAESIFWAAYS